MSETIGPDAPNVWDFDQAAAKIRAKDAEDKHEGYCAGVIVCWILQRRAGGDFTTEQRKQGPLAVLTQPEKQLVGSYQDQHVANTSTGGYKALFSVDIEKSFIIKATNSGYENYDLLDIPRQASRKTKGGRSVSVNGVDTCFFFARFQSPNGGSGHVIALEVQGNYPGRQIFRLMDPNRGCYEISDFYHFSTWFVNTFLKNSGYLQLYLRRIKFNQVIFATPSPTNMPALIFQSTIGRIGF